MGTLKCVCSYLSRDIRANQLEHTLLRVPIGWIFCKQSWLNRVTLFARLTTKQNGMKKAKYLIFDKLEKDCFEKW